jgi:hypothetical protein
LNTEDRGSDETTVISYLKQKASEFVTARDWAKHHNPKDRAISIATEMMAHFQWAKGKEADQQCMGRQSCMGLYLNWSRWLSVV